MLNTLVYLVLYIIVTGMIVGLLLWLIDAVPIPQPFHRFARIAIIVVGVLIIIFLLLSLVDGGPTKFRIGSVAPSGAVQSTSL